MKILHKSAVSSKDMTKQEEIKQLKLEKDAVLLAHYYVPAQVQEIADYVGDSFYLSKVASKLTNKVLEFPLWERVESY